MPEAGVSERLAPNTSHDPASGKLFVQASSIRPPAKFFRFGNHSGRVWSGRVGPTVEVGQPWVWVPVEWGSGGVGYPWLVRASGRWFLAGALLPEPASALQPIFLNGNTE